MLKPELISIIIPSFNGGGKLDVCLNSLNKQTVTGFEIIVVLDGSTDNSKNIIEKYQNSIQFKIKIIEQHNQGRAKSRNNGVQRSSGDLIVFLDDDMIAEPGFIEKHYYYHSNNNGILIGSGYREENAAQNKFSKFIIHVERNWKLHSINRGKVDLDHFNFTACNMSISKKTFEDLSGFDERLKDSEDFDFGMRALKKNITVFYDISIAAFHNDWPKINDFIIRNNQYNIGKKELVKYHPEYIAYLPELSKKSPPKLKRWLLQFFKTVFSNCVIHESPILNYLPLKITFLIYKITISSLTR